MMDEAVEDPNHGMHLAIETANNSDHSVEDSQTLEQNPDESELNDDASAVNSVYDMEHVDQVSMEADSLNHDDNGSDSDDPLLGTSDVESSVSNSTSTANSDNTSQTVGSSIARSSIARSLRSRLQDSVLYFSLRSWPWHRPVSPRRNFRRRRRRCLKRKEQNYGAALCSIVAAVCLCCALVDTSWFTMRGGGCRDGGERFINSLGVFTFLYSGHFEHHSVSSSQRSVEQYYRHGLSVADVLIDCVTPEMIEVLRSIIALCLLSFLLSIVSLMLDILGPSTRTLKFVRRNAVIGILTVIFCVSINGFSFMVTQQLKSLQERTKEHHFNKVEVHFSLSFYLVTAAGAVTVIGCAFNLLRRYPVHHRRSSRSNDQANHYYDSMMNDGLDDNYGAPPPIETEYYAAPPPPYSV